MHFLQFCADLSKKPKSVKVICIWAFGSSHYTLSENDIYGCLSHRYCRLKYQKMLTQQKFNKIFDFKPQYLRSSKSQHNKQYHFLKVRNKIFQINICKSTKFKKKKKHFSDSLRTITQEGNLETRQMTSFFSSTFSVLNVCNIHFGIWSSFSCGHPVGFLLVYKIPQFLVKSYRFGQLIILF